MKPESLLGISIELIAEVAAPGPYPADARLGRFCRQRRYLGGRDRRFLGEAVFAWLRGHPRARARWTAWCAGRTGLGGLASAAQGCAGDPLAHSPRALEAGGDPRPAWLFLCDLLTLAREERLTWTFAELSGAVSEIAVAKAPELVDHLAELTGEEFLREDSWPPDPLDLAAAQMSLPRWLAWKLIEERGETEAQKLAAALGETATLDLRVNLHLADRERVRRSLVKETGVEVEPTHFSPLGLRIVGRRNLTATTASRSGWIEVQDEGSQIVCLAADVEPGMTVIDACAGSGGKTLAFADILARGNDGEPPARGRGRGRVIACDVSGEKLRELRRRAAEANVEDLVESALVSPDSSLSGRLPPADRVLVDAPCSGLGTLRRNPELKLRFGPRDLEAFHAEQLRILERSAPLVRTGGRLVYATCSLVRRECEDVAHAFTAKHPEFTSQPSRWAAGRLPGDAMDGCFLRIDPVRTHTDAFFVASWERVS